MIFDDYKLKLSPVMIKKMIPFIYDFVEFFLVTFSNVNKNSF